MAFILLKHVLLFESVVLESACVLSSVTLVLTSLRKAVPLLTLLMPSVWVFPHQVCLHFLVDISWVYYSLIQF